MKKSFTSIIIIILGLFVMQGCSKDSSITQPNNDNNHTGSGNNTGVAPGTYYYKISSWTATAISNIFTHDEIIPASNNASRVIKVFLVFNNIEIPINNPINFMNGTLIAKTNNLDVTLIYRDGSGNNSVPFSSVNIKVQVQ